MIKKPIISAVSIAFLLLASQALGVGSDVFLTNQNGTKTSQFGLNDKVYIEGLCLPAAGSITKMYITFDKTWANNDSLADISGGIETIAVPGSGEIPKTLIWQMPYEGAFDVIIDTNNDLILQEYEKQCAIGLVGAGFSIGSPPPPPAPAPIPPPPPAPPAASQGIVPPPPAPPPPPTPAEPSQLFSLNDIVAVKNLSNVRKTPGGSLLGMQTKGSEGIVVGGPVRASISGTSYWFWNIDFDDGIDGWVTESTLKIAPAPEPAEEQKKEPEPVIEAAAPPPAGEPTPVAVAPASEDTGTKETSLAQASSTNRDSIMGAVVIGLAILFGLISGSFIIARSLRKG